MIFDPTVVQTGFSVPVAFQNPKTSCSIRLRPFVYFHSLGLKSTIPPLQRRAFLQKRKRKIMNLVIWVEGK